MESGFINTILDWAQANPALAMAAAFVFAFFESLVIVGIFIPGIILLFAVGAVIGADTTSLMLVWLGASSGALAGDGVSYWLGHRYRDRLRYVWPFRRFPDLLDRGAGFIARHGGKSVFIGRFLGPLRPVVPVVAGMLGMQPRYFFAIAVPACILWAPAYLLPGVLFGASLSVISEFGSRLAVVIGVLFGGIWLTGWLVRLMYETAARRSAWWLKSLVNWSRRHPVMGRVVGPILHPSRREVLSVALLGTLLLISFSGLLAVLLLAPFGTPAWDAERVAAGLAASLRNHFADPLFVVLSLAGDLHVMALLAAITTLLLAALHRRNAAWHWLIATGGAWIMALLLNRLMGRLLDPPGHQILGETLGQVPHLGFTLATVTFGFFAVMLAKDLRARSRKWPYLIAWTVLALIGFAHFYLGRASISGLLAGLTLGVGWLALVGIAYRQRSLQRQHPVFLAAGFCLIFLVAAAWQADTRYAATLEGSRLIQPAREMAMEDWWRDDWRELPDRRSRLGRASAQRFDLQLAAPLERVRTELTAAGWTPLPEITLKGLATAFSDTTRPGKLPHLPRDFAGRPQDLALRLVQEDGRVVVLHLWDSGVSLTPGGIPVWLGQVRQVEVRSFGRVMNVWRPVTGGEAMPPLREALSEGHWREVEGGPWLVIDTHTQESARGPSAEFW